MAVNIHSKIVKDIDLQSGSANELENFVDCNTPEQIKKKREEGRELAFVIPLGGETEQYKGYKLSYSSPVVLIFIHINSSLAS